MECTRCCCCQEKKKASDVVSGTDIVLWKVKSGRMSKFSHSKSNQRKLLHNNNSSQEAAQEVHWQLDRRCSCKETKVTSQHIPTEALVDQISPLFSRC